MRLLPARRRTAIAWMLALVLAVASFGWWLNWYRPWEPHYAGRPASWWADHYRTAETRWYPAADERHCYQSITVQPAPGARIRRMLAWIGIGRRYSVFELSETVLIGDELLKGDPAAMPVLLTLLHDPTPKLRVTALQGLGMVGRRDQGVMAAIQGAKQDRDTLVRYEAEQQLRWFEIDELRSAFKAAEKKAGK